MPLSRKSLAAARYWTHPNTYLPIFLPHLFPLSMPLQIRAGEGVGSFQLPLQIIVVGISPANATALFISIWSSVIVSSNTSLDDASSSCWMIVGVSARIDMLKGEIQCSASTEPIGLRTSGRRTSSPKNYIKVLKPFNYLSKNKI